MRSHSRAAIIGGGITGCSIAFHLAKMGWNDIVLLEKGELTSGTTFHSVGLVSQFRTSNALMRLQNYSIALYDELKREVGDALGWYQVGSLRLASSEAQYKNLQRNISRAKGLGLQVEMISPTEAKQIFPPMTEQNLYGAVYIPDDGWLDPNGITGELARRAKQLGAEICTGVRVTGIELDAKQRVCAVNTTHGSIQTEIVINAAGQWAPRIAEMVSASSGSNVTLPMTPLMHQYLLTHAARGQELPKQTPVVRDPDNLVYLREEAGGFLIGGFESNPKAWSVNGVAWDFTQQLLPPEWELFEELLQGAIRRVPSIENAASVKLINGPDAMTPDGHYALGPVPTIPGMWVAAGMSLNGIAGAGGVGRVMAEWIVNGEPSIDVSEMNVRRFGTYYADTAYTAEKARAAYRYYYWLRYPNDEDEWGREKRLSPLYETVKQYGAVLGFKNGWERVNYYDTGKPWRRAGADQRGWGWGRAPYFDTVGAEHRAARERVALFDMTSFGKMDVRGRDALGFLQTLADNDLDKPIGSLTYTQFLNERGGIESDLTIARMGEDHFRIVTGTAFLAGDLGWMELQRRSVELHPEPGPRIAELEIADVTEQFACLGLWGPHARRVLEQVTSDDVSNPTFPYMTAKQLIVDHCSVWAQRVSYVGELGWELYCANEDAVQLWSVLLEAGKSFGIVPAGYKALESLRLEKCYRYWSADITPNETPYESGQGFAVKLNKAAFIGRTALLKQKAEGIKRKLVPLVLSDQCVIYGGEAIWYDRHVVSRVRSGGYGYTLARNIALCYLPIELTRIGTTVQVEIFGERLPATVSADPLYDPKGDKVKA